MMEVVRSQVPPAVLAGSDRPVITLIDDGDPETCLSVMLTRTGDRWIGVVDDKSLLLDRIRMGLRPRYQALAPSGAGAVAGEAFVRVVGPVRSPDEARGPSGDEHPFGVADAVFIEVRLGPPLGATAWGDEPRGAVPRT